MAKKAVFGTHMFRHLFPRLTPKGPRGAELFAAVVSEARRPQWYSALGVPDTIDGRFSMVATIAALVSVRLERGGEEARAATVALTERFVETMDAEHRQLGLGDPTVGKVVRKLVGGLSRRIALWREIAAGGDWMRASADSVDGADGGSQGLADELRAFWRRIEETSDTDLLGGRFR